MLISICIPAYKIDFLEAAINSVLNQTYTNIEIIIVNDKSPNHIQSIVSQFDDSRIRYYENEKNLGGKNLISSWNRCLSYVKGEYFCFLCDDDLYYPEHIQNLVNLIYKYPHIYVFKARTHIIDCNDNIIDLTPASPEFEEGYDYLWHILNVKRRQTLSELLFKTSEFEKNGGFIYLPLAWGSDQLTCIKQGFEHGIVSSHSATVAFRMSSQNLSSWNPKTGRQKMIGLLMFHEYITNELLPKVEKEEILKILQFLNRKRRIKILIDTLSWITISDFLYFLFNSKKYKISKHLFIPAFLNRPCVYWKRSSLRNSLKNKFTKR